MYEVVCVGCDLVCVGVVELEGVLGDWGLVVLFWYFGGGKYLGGVLWVQ